MNINKKGFTLIELLATIVMLSVITIISFPKISKLIEKTKNNLDNSTKIIVENAAKVYVNNNEELIQKKLEENNNKYCLALGTLSAYGYLSNELSSSNKNNIDLKRCVYVTKIVNEETEKYNFEFSSDTVSEDVDYLPPIITIKNIDESLNTCKTNMYDSGITKEEFYNMCKIEVTDDTTMTFTLGTNLLFTITTKDDMTILKYVATDDSGNESIPLKIKLKNNEK